MLDLLEIRVRCRVLRRVLALQNLCWDETRLMDWVVDVMWTELYSNYGEQVINKAFKRQENVRFCFEQDISRMKLNLVSKEINKSSSIKRVIIIPLLRVYKFVLF